MSSFGKLRFVYNETILWFAKQYNLPGKGLQYEVKLLLIERVVNKITFRNPAKFRNPQPNGESRQTRLPSLNKRNSSVFY